MIPSLVMVESKESENAFKILIDDYLHGIV